MASVTDLRKAIAARLATVTGLRVTYYVADRISPPCAAVALTDIEFDSTFGRGSDELSFTIRVYASRADDRAGQDRLDSFLAGSGPKSIKAAMDADQELGGLAFTSQISAVSAYGVFEVGGVEYVGADLTVKVCVPGEEEVG